MLIYPRQPRNTPKRVLKLSDFPRKINTYIEKAREYFTSHSLEPQYVRSIDTLYPTRQGICFVLHGALAYQERVFNDTRRYIYPANAGMAKAVYMPQPDHEGKELILVEGSADALAINQLGLRSVSYLGTWIPTERLNVLAGLVRDVNKVYVIPDSDAAGQHGLQQILRAIPWARVLQLPIGIKDVCELTKEQLKLFLTSTTL